MKTNLPRHLQQGVSSIEYALLSALIAVFCLAMVGAVGTRTLSVHMLICDGVALATGNPPC